MTATPSETTPATPIEFGRVARLTFQTLRQNLQTYLLMAVIFAAIPTMIGDWLVDMMVKSNPNLDKLEAFRVTVLAGGIERIISYPMIAGVIFGVLAQIGGRTATFQECVTKGVNVWIVIFSLNFVIGLGQTVGFLLLIVPGVFLMVMWAVAVPAQVAENPKSAMKRSAELTKGRRWTVAGLILAFGASYFLLSFLVGLVGTVLASLSPALTAMQYVLDGGAEIVTGLIGAAGSACLYHELRRTREGETSETVAGVFS
jgi:hypothetical protein